jgi:hypothetical protein
VYIERTFHFFTHFTYIQEALPRERFPKPPQQPSTTSRASTFVFSFRLFFFGWKFLLPPPRKKKSYGRRTKMDATTNPSAEQILSENDFEDDFSDIDMEELDSYLTSPPVSATTPDTTSSFVASSAYLFFFI